MIVVADTSPINYLVMIGTIDILPPLYGRVLIPEAVAAELQNKSTPASVHVWMAQLPEWCEVRPNPPVEP